MVRTDESVQLLEPDDVQVDVSDQGDTEQRRHISID